MLYRTWNDKFRNLKIKPPHLHDKSLIFRVTITSIMGCGGLQKLYSLQISECVTHHSVWLSVVARIRGQCAILWTSLIIQGCLNFQWHSTRQLISKESQAKTRQNWGEALPAHWSQPITSNTYISNMAYLCTGAHIQQIVMGYNAHGARCCNF